MIEGTANLEKTRDPELWRASLVERIIHDRKSLQDDFILELYRYQYAFNAVYRQYTDLVKKAPSQVEQVTDIPYLPISFFKSHTVQTGSWLPFTKFESSGTTGSTPSVHAIRDEKLYLINARACWKEFYQEINQYCFFGLLPSYLEKGNSSLVRMVEYFIGESKYKQSAFFLHKYEELSQELTRVIEQNVPTVLIGVTYALLDLADHYPMNLEHVIVIETGGMKGRREELPKKKVHEILSSRFKLDKIHSEYGMTECFSQAYSKGDGLFNLPRSMRVSLCELNDPLATIDRDSENTSARGRIQICDMANIDSCAFIATEDLGQWESGQLRILGRISDADLRGCNLMVD